MIAGSGNNSNSKEKERRKGNDKSSGRARIGPTMQQAVLGVAAAALVAAWHGCSKAGWQGASAGGFVALMLYGRHQQSSLCWELIHCFVL